MRDEPSILHGTVKTVLSFTESHQCRSLALPAISSGIFGFPKRLCAKTIFDAIEEYAGEHTDFLYRCQYLGRVQIVIIDDITFKVFLEEFSWRYHQRLPPRAE